MISKTRGVFLHQFKYKDSSIIAKILTEEHGIKPFIIKGIRSKNAVVKANMMQPLTLLDLVVWNQEKKSNWYYIKEASFTNPQTTIPFDIVKSSLAVFVAEIVLKSIKDEQTDRHLFEFIFKTIDDLDKKQEGFSLFHLHFLSELSENLGFSISEKHNNNLIPSLFVNWDETRTEILNLFYTGEGAKLNRQQRNSLLEIFICCYEQNVIHKGEIKSHKILENLF
jgi:DNA repair protein RecO (recombination protein O)